MAGMDNGQNNTAYISRYVLRLSMGMDWGTTIMTYDADMILGMTTFLIWAA